MGHRDDLQGGGAAAASPEHDRRRRRDALAQNICARLHDARRSLRDIRLVDRKLMELEREPVAESFKVYVAGSSNDLARVMRAIAELRGAGLEVVSTWPSVIANTPGGANPRDASDESRFGWVSQDLAEVEESDGLLMLVPDVDNPTRGAWGEALFAYAVGKHLVFAGDTKQSVFCAVGEEFAEDDTAIRYLVRIARDRRRMAHSLRELGEATAIDKTPRPSIDEEFDDGGGFP